MSRLKTIVRNQNGVPPLRGGHSLCQGCGVPIVVRTVLSTIRAARRRRQRDGLPRGRDDALSDDGVERPLAPRRVRERRRGRERRRERPASTAPPARPSRRRGGRGRRLRRRRRHVRHRAAGPLRRPRARPPVPLRLLRQRGVHEHGRPALGRDALRRSTTTSPAGRESFGKAQLRKDMTAIAVAHHVPYVAQAAATHWHDLSTKVERAVAAEGPAFLNVLTDCPRRLGPRAAARQQVDRCRGRTCFWPLYEVVDGEYRLTYEPRERSRSRSGSARRSGSRTSSGPRTRCTSADPGEGRGGLGVTPRALSTGYRHERRAARLRRHLPGPPQRGRAAACRGRGPQGDRVGAGRFHASLRASAERGGRAARLGGVRQRPRASRPVSKHFVR